MLSLLDLLNNISTSGSYHHVECNGLTLTAKGLLTESIPRFINKPIVVFCDKASKAEEFVDILNFFNSSKNPNPMRQIIYFPPWEILPFEEISPHPEITKQRVSTLSTLLNCDSHFTLVTSIEAVARKIVPNDVIIDSLLGISVGDSLDTEVLADHLISTGYRRSETVCERGEFSIRGNIVDIFGGATEIPYRIELLADEVESLRLFDPNTQRSTDAINNIKIIPHREVFYRGCNQKNLAEAYLKITSNTSNINKENHNRERIFNLIESAAFFKGMESLMPLFFHEPGTLFDYLPNSCAFIIDEPEAVTKHLEEFMGLAKERYISFTKSGNGNLEFEKLFMPLYSLKSQLDKKTIIRMRELPVSSKDNGSLTVSSHTPDQYKGNLKKFLGDLKTMLTASNWVILITSTETGAKRLSRLLTENNLSARIISKNELSLLMPSMLKSQPAPLKGNLLIVIGSLPEGMVIPSDKLSFITEYEIFGRARYIRHRKKPENKPFNSGTTNLEPGNLVVHKTHGVGRYVGANEMVIAGSNEEYMEIEYAETQKLYVPLRDLYLLTKFIGSRDGKPPLDKMGGTTWKKTKTKVKNSLLHMAKELLTIYATRELAGGHSFSLDSTFHNEFRETFEFEETEDQLSAIMAVASDMESSRPMDRLVCGDVGYGKTEVAMRAVFKSVFDGKQAAVLVPTTLLAQQHYHTFSERFKSFPVKIQSLSRFKSRQEQKEIIEQTTTGEVDVLIGTHRLLQRDINFNNLGLIVIDEEQRFGVKHKEKLRNIRQSVDVLTMTATPIPRTLQTALLGIRDLSVIETPPPGRLSIQTFICKFSEDIIKEAMLRELDRGGQVFFLHNNIKSIYSIASLLKKLVPQSRIAVAHGQMQERELESVMVDFIDQKYDVLVCTTIIDSGLDIASTNAILINRADRFGLAQLYQLRGRIGRDKHRAYCYLLIPGLASMTVQAQKRLKAIEELSELGSGFKLAAKDMEIRGSGNLLGPEQSGQINAVGFDTYCDMLEECISELKGDPTKQQIEMDFNLNLVGRIPPTYISELAQRIELYNRLHTTNTINELSDLSIEMKDRFGPIPEEAEKLLAALNVKILVSSIGVEKVDVVGSKTFLTFSPSTTVTPEQLINASQISDSKFSFVSENMVELRLIDDNWKSRLYSLTKFLEFLLEKQ